MAREEVAGTAEEEGRNLETLTNMRGIDKIVCLIRFFTLGY